MKAVIFVISIFSLNALAESDFDKVAHMKQKCKEESNVSFSYEAGEDSFDPKEIFVREGDRVCLTLKSLDNKKKVFFKGKAEFLEVESSEETDVTMIHFNKTGEIPVTCSGCDFMDEKDFKVVVMSKEEFDAKLREKNKEDSFSKKRK